MRYRSIYRSSYSFLRSLGRRGGKERGGGEEGALERRFAVRAVRMSSLPIGPPLSRSTVKTGEERKVDGWSGIAQGPRFYLI